MGDLDSLIQSKLQDVDKNAVAIDNVLTGGYRTPPTMPSATGVFQNGSDLTRPAGTASTIVNAAPATAGSATLVLDDTVEFLHFGTVYRDRASAFVHPTLNDSDPKLNVSAVLGGHAIAYRAGLERESILMSGFFAAHMAALSERDSDLGTLGKVMAVVGNLFGGGGGGASQAEPADLNPLVAKVKAIGKELDVTTITYQVTHSAGIELHNLRASYISYLDGEIDKRKTSTPDAGLLASIPMLSNVLPKEIGNIFTVVEKMSSKAFDIYVKLVLALTRTMMPVVETACRDLTIDAITKQKAPIFNVWMPAPEVAPTEDPLIQAPDAPAALGIGPVDSLVSTAFGDLASGVKKANAVVDPAADFLSLPAKPAPGGPFLDEAFGQLNDGSGYLTTAAGVTGIGEIALVAVEQAFGFKKGDLPGFVETLVSRICGAHVDFLRGVYGQLISLDPTQPIVEGQLVAAGRAHLVSQIIDAVVHSVSFLQKIKDFRFNLNLFGPIERLLSGDALYARGIELVNAELGPHLDPLVEAMMKSFAAELEAARQASQPGMTMEVYLSRLPSLQALLFRKTFFPVWDLMVSTVFKPVSDLLDPMVGRTEDLAKKAHGIVDTVRTGLLRAEKLVHTILTEGVTGAVAGGTNLSHYAAALAATLPAASPPPAVQAAATTFPLPGRNDTGSGTAVDAATLKAVAPTNKWVSSPSTASPGGAPAASGSSSAAVPGATAAKLPSSF